MGIFGSSEAETVWSTRCEELEYDIRLSIELAQEALGEMQRMQSSTKRLRDVTKQYQGADRDTLFQLADLLERAVKADLTAVINAMRSAVTSAAHIGHSIGSFG